MKQLNECIDSIPGIGLPTLRGQNQPKTKGKIRPECKCNFLVAVEIEIFQVRQTERRWIKRQRERDNQGKKIGDQNLGLDLLFWATIWLVLVEACLFFIPLLLARLSSALFFSGSTRQKNSLHIDRMNLTSAPKRWNCTLTFDGNLTSRPTDGHGGSKGFYASKSAVEGKIRLHQINQCHQFHCMI